MHEEEDEEGDEDEAIHGCVLAGRSFCVYFFSDLGSLMGNKDCSRADFAVFQYRSGR